MAEDDPLMRVSAAVGLLTSGMWLELDHACFYSAFGHRLDGTPAEREEALAKAEAFAVMHDATFVFDETHLTARFGRHAGDI
jgi:hypothetical protein